MLKPRDIELLPDSLIQLYSQVEQDILADMARRISAYDYWIPSVEWQYRKLIEMGNFHSFVTEALAARTPYFEKEIRQLMQLAATKSLKFDTDIYKQHGLNPPPLAASEGLRRTLNAGLRQTKGTFKNLTSTTANTVGKQFEDASDRAWLQVTSGAFDQHTATRTAIKDLARQGVEAIKYPSGHADNLEVAVTRAIRTGVNQTCLQLQSEMADEMGCDLVEVTAHAGARPSHAEWQGQIYSRSGNHPKYPEFESSTGYGTGAGLGGWNCRHSFFPYFEGSARAYTEKQLRDYNAQNYEYKGQKMTEYEATQQQRYIERKIRRWKREENAMKAAGQDASEATGKIKRWQSRQRDYLEKTGLKRQWDREQIGEVVDSSRLSLNKHYEKDAKSGIIITREKRITPKRYPVTQAQIDDILKEELRGIKFSGNPTYNARIGSQGKTTIECYPWGEAKGVKSTLIGQQAKSGKTELIDTLIHEELEARIFLRRTKKHLELLESGRDDVIHPYINRVIARYVRMRGW